MNNIPHEVVILLAGIGIANVVSTGALVAVILFRGRGHDEIQDETEIEERRRL